MLQRYFPASPCLILANTLSLYHSAAILIPVNLTDIIFCMKYAYVCVCVKMYYKNISHHVQLLSRKPLSRKQQPNQTL